MGIAVFFLNGFLVCPVVFASEPDEEELFLVGTVLCDSEGPLAIIEVGQKGEQELYHLHDVVSGGELASIRHDGVTLVFADRTVELSLEGSPNAERFGAPTDAYRVQPSLHQAAPGFWRMDRDTLNELSRARELVSKASALGDEGVRIDEVQPDGLFQTLGLQKGDIIRNINGRVPGADRSMAEELAETGWDDSMLRVEVDRQGQMDVVYFEITP